MNGRRMTHEPTPDEVADAEDLIAIEAAEVFEDRKAQGEDEHEAQRRDRMADGPDPEVGRAAMDSFWAGVKHA